MADTPHVPTFEELLAAIVKNPALLSQFAAHYKDDPALKDFLKVAGALPTDPQQLADAIKALQGNPTQLEAFKKQYNDAIAASGDKGQFLATQMAPTPAPVPPVDYTKLWDAAKAATSDEERKKARQALIGADSHFLQSVRDVYGEDIQKDAREKENAYLALLDTANPDAAKLEDARKAAADARTKLLTDIEAANKADATKADKFKTRLGQQDAPPPTAEPGKVDALNIDPSSQTEPARGVTAKARNDASKQAYDADVGEDPNNLWHVHQSGPTVVDGKTVPGKIEVTRKSDPDYKAVFDPEHPDQPPKVFKKTGEKDGQPVYDTNPVDVTKDPKAKSFQDAAAGDSRVITGSPKDMQEKLSKVQGFDAHFAKNSTTIDPSEQGLIHDYVARLAAGGINNVTIPVHGLADTTGEPKVTGEAQLKLARARQQAVIDALKAEAQKQGVHVNFQAGAIDSKASERVAGVGSPQPATNYKAPELAAQPQPAPGATESVNLSFQTGQTALPADTQAAIDKFAAARKGKLDPSTLRLIVNENGPAADKEVEAIKARLKADGIDPDKVKVEKHDVDATHKRGAALVAPKV